MCANRAGLAEHAREFACNERDLVAQAGGRLVIVQHGHCGAAGEAEGEQAAARIQCEGFCSIDADQRRKSAQLTCDVRRLALEFSGVGFRLIGVAEHMRTVQADTGAEAGLRSEKFDHTRCGEVFLRAEQCTQQQLIGLSVEWGETEEGMLHCSHFGRCR